MRPFLVCDRHREPMRFDSLEEYNRHMKEWHRERYYEILQVQKDIEALKRIEEDPYDEYYGR